jgi:hypothetical protein
MRDLSVTGWIIGLSCAFFGPSWVESAESASQPLSLKPASDWLNVEPIGRVTPEIEKIRCRMALQIIGGKAVEGTPEFYAALSDFNRAQLNSNKDQSLISYLKEGLSNKWNRGDKVSLYVSKQDREQIDRLVSKTLETYPKDNSKLDHVTQLKSNLDNPMSSDPEQPFLIHVQRVLGKSIVKERLDLIDHALDSYVRRWSKRDLLFMAAAFGFSISPAAEPIAEHITLALTTAGSLAVARLLANMSRMFEEMKHYLRADFIDFSKAIVADPEDQSMKHLSWGLRLKPEEVNQHLEELMKPEDFNRFEEWKSANQGKEFALIFDYNVTRNDVGVPVIVNVLRVAKTR